VCGTIPANSLAVGTPARVMRSGVTWDRRRLPLSPETEGVVAEPE
jgi:serine acetyltransferase